MIASVITKIYLALSGFKSNIKSLPGNPEAFEDDTVTAIRVQADEIAALLNNISSLFESGLDEENLKCTIQVIERLPLNHSERFTYNVFYIDELTGLSMIVTKEQQSMVILYFITEESLAHVIQNILEVFHASVDGEMH